MWFWLFALQTLMNANNHYAMSFNNALVSGHLP